MKKKGCRYGRKIALAAVAMVEAGAHRQDVLIRFGTSAATLEKWMLVYGSERYHQHKRKSYSKTEKRTIVSAVINGMSFREAVTTYGLKDAGLLRKWIRESEKEKSDICVLQEPMAKKEHPDKSSEDVAALRRELELAKLKIEALNTLIDVAEDQLKIDIRKKSGARRSSK